MHEILSFFSGKLSLQYIVVARVLKILVDLGGILACE